MAGDQIGWGALYDILHFHGSISLSWWFSFHRLWRRLTCPQTLGCLESHSIPEASLWCALGAPPLWDGVVLLIFI